MDIQMQESCVADGSCNTYNGLWLNGPHPQIEDGVVTMEVCGGRYYGCCDFKSTPIRVKACPGDFYVYELVKPHSFQCSGYCTAAISTDIDPCYDYNILDNSWRTTFSVSFQYAHDDTLVEWHGWYRLFIDGSSAQMPEWCFSYMSCGGFTSLWLGGPHPQPEDGVVTREVYGSYYTQCSYYRSDPIQVKACPGNYYVYKIKRPKVSIPAPAYCAVAFTTPSADPCYNYNSLDEPRRATISPHYDKYYSYEICDYNVNWNGWYRLFFNGQSVQMPDSCVGYGMCGTYHPLWLNGPHPQLEDGVVTRQVCASTWNDCCGSTSHPIQVKACPGNYYVYEFVRPPICSAYCAGPFYPFGDGDTENDRSDDGISPVISLLQPFIFFGQTYNQLYINNNGYLTFDWSWYSYFPYQFPGYGGIDLIAPFWTDIDNRGNGVISYRQYTSGSVLTDATQDINQYFPELSFFATWVFVATWDSVAYYSYTGTETSFQVVLISDGHFSFVLFNYGTIAPTQRYVQAGYDTISSTYHFSITESLQSNITSLTYSSNVNVPGRWVFRTDHGSRGCQFNGLPVQLGDSFWSDATCQQRCTCTSSGLQCSHEPCGYSQVCRPAAFQFSCQNIQRQTCTISGDPHYYTFDYQVFHFQGTCTYVLSEACGYGLPYYRIEGKNEHRGSTHVSWTRMVRVLVYDEVIELVKDHYYEARVNGSFAATPFTLRNGSIQVYQSGFSLAISTDFGLLVTYDAYSYVSISVPYDYFNATCGLCGNFNLHPEDDFRSPSGEVLSSDVDFANSWMVQSDTDPECHNVRCTGLACAVCTTDETTLYGDSNHCGILEDVFGPFADCHSVHAPQTYKENCVYDLCLGGGYQPILCQALNVYATQCQQQGVHLGQWRQQGFCEIQCPEHSHFEAQGTGCPATCSNPSASINCPLLSQESCICDPGYILSAGECVPEANCGCIFEGFYYAEGQSVVLDGDCGRQCVCSSMSMTCNQHQCGPAEVCGVHDGVRGCRPTGYATCSVEDLGSYHTFDGLSFRYPGACRLTLARVMGPSPLTHFVLTVEKVPRGLQDFSRFLKFEAEGIQVSIEMGEGSNVKVDGQVVGLPVSAGSGQIRIYHSSVRGFVLETNFGVTVRADWPHIVRIMVPSTYSGTLGGLCGNFNGDIADEFYTPDAVLLNDTQQFADSWRDGSLSANCVDPNDSWETGHYQNSSQFFEHCSIMAKHDGPFAECSRAIDPQQRILDCVQLLEQTQGAREALCEALRGYTLLCQQNGIAVEEWRSATHCDPTCPENTYYEICGTSCPSSCPSLSFPFQCTLQCQEGCQCNDGNVLNKDRCVPPVGCGCYHSGRYRQAGETFRHGEECQFMCVCDGITGNVRCTPSSCSEGEVCHVLDGEYGCHPRPHATCYASGDPHYKSFDGTYFDFQGTCRYVLATVCNDTIGLPHFQVDARNEAWHGLSVSLTVEIFVNVSGHLVHMSRDMNRHFTVEVDGETRNLPILLDSGRVSVYSSAQYTFVSTNFGLSVGYSGSWAVNVIVPAEYSGVTCGICGNFNGQSNDDFMTSSGALVRSADQFGASWKVEDELPCSDGCGNNCPLCQDQTTSRSLCEIIRSSEGPFSFCHVYVDPQAYFDDCVFDVCLSGNLNDVLCHSIQTYASACQSNNAVIYPWRESASCVITCPENSHYELCGTDCLHTCASNIDASCEHTCSEGCFCNDDLVMSGGLCVPVEQCGCLYDGFYFNVGEHFWNLECSQHCECFAPNDLRCSASSCQPNMVCMVRNGRRDCYEESTTYTTTTGSSRPSEWSTINMTTTRPIPPAVFYPFGAGDTENYRSDDGSSSVIYLLQQFIFFGQTYSQIHVNNNGHLTFDESFDSYSPNQFPGYGGIDLIAPFWTDIDNRGNGVISYRQYTSGSVLTQATQDINQYFPDLSFSATWVFVATWDRVAYFPYSGTETSFQVVLISDGHYTFILMNYGPIAPRHYVQAGYDTVNSRYHFSIPGSFLGDITNLTYSSNVDVPGRWAFRTDHGSRGCQFKGSPVQLGDSFWSDATCQQRCTCTSSGLQCSHEPCSYSQACRPAAFQYSCQNIQRQTCTISGDPHYYTFDYQVFHFQGTCTYVLSEACGNGLPYYRIEGKNEHRGSTHVSWTRMVRVFVYDEVIELVRDHSYEARVNGSFATTPFTLRNGSIQVYQSGFYVAISTDFGLVVTYDAYSYVSISVPYDYLNSTCGLCGNFNLHPEDDFRSPSGEILSSDVDFANSWKVDSDTDPECHNVRCTGLACAVCTTDEMTLYGDSNHCGILEDVFSPFGACHSVHAPQTYKENCVYDLCLGGGYQPILCQALNVYATQCQQQGVQLGQWRQQGFCEIQCPEHSHFEAQGTGCPATCSNPSAPMNCPLPSQESCICDPGYILSAGECVPEANCGCIFEGFYYAEGQSVVLDGDCGRRCVCSSMSMTCYQHQCGPAEVCGVHDGVRGCRPTGYATCSVEDLGSYHTFDGLSFRYPGACGLTLARVMGSSPLTHFVLTVEKVPRGLQDFSRFLKFEAEGIQVSIEMGEGSNVKVDGQVVGLPVSVGSGQIRIYHSSVRGFVLETNFGVTVRADWPHIVRIMVPSTYSGALGGLCGNFNEDIADEFYTPDAVLLNDTQLFADSWRDGSLSANCVEPNDSWETGHYQNSSQFFEHCSIMAKHDGPFAECSRAIDPQQRIVDCVQLLEQTQGAREALCEALRGYTLLCQQNGIAVGEWRSATHCDPSCPENAHYEVCGTSCPSSCPSLSFPFQCTLQCQEGCQCNDGNVLNKDHCVPPVGCGCYHSGRYRQAGETFRHGEECQFMCFCDGITGNVHCTPSSCSEVEVCHVLDGEYGCHPRPHATCYASGDPHYKSFDGTYFDFQGTCRYVLATVCNDTIGLPHFQVDARNEAWHGLSVSLTVEIFVNVSGHLVHMSRDMNRHFTVEVDGETRNLPILLDSGRVSVYSSAQYTFVSTDFGLSVGYSGSWAVNVIVPAEYSGVTCGICGNFNGQSNDDFMTSSGALVRSADQFGASWKVEDELPCNDGCGNNCPLCQDQTTSRSLCEIIRSSEGPFSFCHVYVDPQAYFDDCVFDVCLSGNLNDVLCHSIQTYASACQSNNAVIYPWRESTSCVITCPENSHYELCGTDCLHTCASNIDASCEHTCSEGCFCNDDLVMSGGLCVPVEQCGCLYDGFYFNVGEHFWNLECSQHCECFAPNDLRCSASSCQPNMVCMVRNGRRDCYEESTTYTTTTRSSRPSERSTINMTTTRPIPPAVFYPFGAGDTENYRSDDGSSSVIYLLQQFIFFGQTYSQIHVNNNGHLTFDESFYSSSPHQFPGYGQKDIIAPFWTDIDDRGNGVISYRQYTSGSVLTQATQDINQYFPDLSFSATWVFVATWDRVAYFPYSGTETSFQVVLISDGHYTFILMNYGPIAPRHYVQAGYDTVNSRYHFSIPGSFSGDITNLTYSSNVDVPGRWAFRTDHGSRGCQFNGSPVQLGDSFWSDATCQQRCTCTSSGLQYSHEPCSYSQACRPAAFQYSCQNIQRQTCTISGDPHYYTFDYQVFHFQGTCTYVLSEACGNGLPYYRIEGKNEHRGSTHVSWTRMVRVFVYDEVIELVRDHSYEARVNGSFATTPFTLRNGSIQVYQSGFYVAISTDFGLVVTYDAYSYVSISVPYDYLNSTCGLCGNFNLHPEDDFRSPSGEILSSDVDFANSWKVDSDTDPECHNVRCTGLACAVCTTDEMTLYGDNNHCGILEDVFSPFGACHSVHAPQTYKENCVYDLCLGGGYQPILCQALNVYATQCQQQGVQLGQWRQQGFCEIQCPEHSHFEAQGTGCPATCSNPSAPMNCPLPSQESCICDTGYILSAGECVPEANCGCIFEGFYYAEGQSVVLDGDCGRRCVCSSMSMTCYQHQCGPAEVCGVHDGVRGCRPTGYATCSVEDIGSYHTFDGLSFRYPGACGLTLARVMGPSPLTHFVLTVEKVPRGLQDFSRFLKFEAEGIQVSIEMGEGSNVKVDGQVVGLPVSVGSGQIRIYHSSVRGFVLETNFGVTVRADWPHIVRIMVPSTYSGTLGGLCGNFNGDIADEFYTPDAVLLNDAQLFADSWRDGSLSANCVEPNDSWETGHYQNSSQFFAHCSIMAKHDGPFAECSRAIDSQQRIVDCVQLLEQTQGAREALCEALRGYTLLCQQNGIAVEEWRSATHCDPSCPEDTHYEVCGTSCPSSCPSLSFPFQCTLQCQEGCQCNDGNVLNKDRCVPPVGCGCYHSGRYRQAGETFRHGEECQFMCVCDGITGNVHCTPSSCSEVEVCHVLDGEYGCHPRPHATCYASGDPHYKSFDGTYFDFQGTCRYVLATVCNDTIGLPHFQVDARNEAWHGLSVSLTVEIFVNVSGHLVHMSRDMNRRFTVEVDGETRNLPILLDSGRVSVYSSAQYTYVSTDFGLSVVYSGSWAVNVIVPAEYSGVTCGICGNFNGQSNDDFMTSSGALVRSADQFGASWKVEDELPCNDGCGNNCPLCQDQTTSRSLCEIIRSSEGPFSFCHVYVDPQAYFDDCVFDECLSGNLNDVLCHSIQTYASACQSNNAVIYPWRESASCVITCPENSHYELCGTDCLHTCASNIDASCEHTCSEGCFCNDDLVMSGGLCVPVEQCGCLYDGFYFNVSEHFWNLECSQHCECFAPNDLRCSASSCQPNMVCMVRNGRRDCYEESTTYTTTTGSSRPSERSTINMTTTRPIPPAVFYPFGAGDTENYRSDDGSSSVIYLLQQFIFFGQTYSQIHVNNNGHLTFDQPFDSYSPNQFPGYGGIDLIAPFWTDIDNRGNGVISYRQYISGSVLTQATQDINQYFPDLSFSATWVFVATWDRVAYFPYSGTETSFQVVLISDGHYTFILMNYGPIAPIHHVQAGYDTVNSRYHFSIPGSFLDDITNLTYSSNVDVPGRWAFRTDHGSRGCQFKGLPVQLGDSFWSDASCQQRCTCTSSGLQCSHEPCSYSQACRPAAFQYSCQNIQRQTCTISGDPHYYTFDYQVFHFQGTCTYVLSEACGNGLPYYRIEGKNEHRGSTHVSWTRMVRVFVYDEVIELVRDHSYEARVNGSFATTPFTLRNGSIQVYQSGFYVAISTDFGLVVTYDAYSYVSISVPYDYLNSTCGLCGNFNLHPEDDFRSPSGEILSSDVDFANSWKVDSDTDPECHNVRCTGLACAVCTTDEMTLYGDNNHCGILEDVFSPFGACHSVHAPQTYKENCVYDLCLGGGYQPILCQALNVYATQCQQQGVQLGQWRQQGFCEIQCPEHSHFEAQGTGCPATCSNPSAPMNCPLPSQESCICDTGYILSAGECVPEANCGCIFEGFYYAEGQSVVLDGDCGRRCVCSSMSMNCYQHQCGPAEVCGVHDGVRGCRPTGYATCSVEDLGSYHTFDGLSFRYPGACGLTLARVMGPSPLTHFVLTVEKVPRGLQDFSRFLKFEAEGIQVSIEMGEGSNVKVDGQVVGLPVSVGSGQIHIYHSSVRGFVLETNFGVTVRADWPHIVRITVPSTYSGALGGLCGNFNGDIADEFYTPDAVLLNDTQLFADSWRDGSLSANCVEPNDSWETGHYQNSSQFFEHCSIMAKHDGPFAECSRAIDPQQRIVDCVQLLEQTQGAREALCEALRGYVLLCQQNGIAVEEWRSATHCDPTCPENTHYEVCGTSCPSSCPSLSFPFQCTLQCQEGCQCNDGNVLNRDRCVPPVGCGCYHSGRYRQAGETFRHGEECQFMCVCDGITGNVHCTPSSCSEVEVCHVLDGEYGCHPRPHATCYASGDPHYKSFDGTYFDFQGTCRYVLATVCNDTIGLPHFQVDARNEAWHGLSVSLTVEIFVNVSGHLVHMSRDMNRHFTVEVDGETRNLPILLDSGRVSVYSSAQYTFVSTDFGLSVVYSGSWAVNVIVPAEYSGVTCGICGNFNGQSNDDFMTSSGALVRSADQFGASWKVEDELPCNDGCGNNCPLCQDQTTSRSLCEIIRSSEGPFSFCHVYVDPQAYFDDCVFDVCLSGNLNDVLCHSIQTYASACQSNNAVIYPWRESASCVITCPENSHYELCGTDCLHTCASNIDASCEHTCSEGCFCNDDLVMSGGLCVPVEQCGCLYDGFYFNVGEQFFNEECSLLCECFAPNDLRCSDSSCPSTMECTIKNGLRGCYEESITHMTTTKSSIHSEESTTQITTTTSSLLPEDSTTHKTTTRTTLPSGEGDPCYELSCTGNERCEQKHGVYGCSCMENHHRSQHDSFDFTETCEGSSGSISLPRCQLFEAGFPSDILHLNDPNCRGTVRNGRVEFYFDNNDHVCGTNLMANGTHFIYENFIVGEPNLVGHLISRKKILKLSFSCVYPQIQTLSMDINPLESTVHMHLPAGQGTYRVRMIPYQDAEFSHPFAGSVNAELNKRIFVEVNVDGVDSRQFASVIDRCWATPVNDPHYPLRWDLIVDGCPNPNDDTVELLQNGVSTSSRFSFEMFIFTADSTKVYLHCGIHLCLLTGNHCSVHCDSEHHHRDRRSVDFHGSTSISLGPMMWSDSNKDTPVPRQVLASRAPCLLGSLTISLISLMSILIFF
ncbi:IgGFc-binding protein [Garra rufa]|uniref:IgGFc-binding protein n=1 Tax=Garra rufa TaxID=137080 RepID=UPI003CCE733A